VTWLLIPPNRNASAVSRTTQENIDGFKALYEKCVGRDTPIAETMAGVKTSITYN